ncbi:tRNA-dependent cyclodipeptide synthase [Streptomyces rubrolavendulae]|uniref:Cyclodipeptide synthase n=1 Tax=Streptomyces rubrolavendulae TaxID=285473 RepID=A0A1D8G8Z8_9ACTN|nr:tRNA-dependent cyclodipeptide synthase [Streptomyces rubrolavendulae]AOT61926.1 Cyclo(L-tyrosyl-L-tyrosyl) synthase [Streptomyces rubrolavendulae]
MFEIEPLTGRCGALLPEAVHVCVGVSPFNGYFSAPRLLRLAEWSLRRFPYVHFFVPDTVAAYTLEALGYPPGRARHKARRQGQYVHNKICSALRELGVPDPDGLVLGMDRLERSPRYTTLLNEARLRFRRDQGFRSACLEASHWVLEQRLPPGTSPTVEQLHGAVRYFLAELPLFADAGGIAGRRPSFFAYHQRVPFLERFFGRELGWEPADTQGFLVVRDPAPEDAAAGLHEGRPADGALAGEAATGGVFTGGPPAGSLATGGLTAGGLTAGGLATGGLPAGEALRARR